MKEKRIRTEYDFFMALKDRPEKYRKTEFLFIATILEAYDIGITEEAFEKSNVQIFLFPFNGKDRVICVRANNAWYDISGLMEMFKDVYKKQFDDEFESVYKYLGRTLDVPMITSSLNCAYDMKW